MSLVNDLLIEIDRQNEEEGHGPSAFMRDLKPRSRERKSIARRAFHGIAMAACLSFVGLGLSQIMASPPSDAERPSPVAARPIASTPARVPTEALLAPVPTARIVERPPSIRNLSIERRARSTRVRIEGDHALVHRLDQAPAGRGIELVFDGATLDHDLGTLDLVGTPIRSFTLDTTEGALHLRVDLDTGTRIQSQSFDAPEGTTIFLDLQSAPPTPDEWATTPPGSPPAPALPEKAPEPAAAAAVAIEPSLEDRARREKLAARRAANETLEKARAAAEDGDDAAANEHYRAAVELAPTNRDALVEWATLLARGNQAEHAIELVRRARLQAPDDARLTMLHARLLDGVGRAADAIAILDASRATLTQAPEIHSLAAALLQRAGRHLEAIERYDAIVRRYPEDAKNWLGLAISLDAERRNDEALDVYRIAMQIGTLPRPSRRWVSTRIEALETDGEG